LQVDLQRRVKSLPPELIRTDPSSNQFSDRTLQMTQRRFARLTNGFSKKLANHTAAVNLYVAHYNLCRVHEALRTTPVGVLGVADRVWTIGDLIDAVLPLEAMPMSSRATNGIAWTVCQSRGKIGESPSMNGISESNQCEDLPPPKPGRNFFGRL
jgi:hypothetical protein